MKQVNDMIILKLKTRNLAVPTLLVKKSELLKSSIQLGILLACCIKKKVFSYVHHHGEVQKTEFFLTFNITKKKKIIVMWIH